MLDPADVQLFYQIGLIGQRDLPLAPDPRSGFEMVLLRMLAFRPEGGDIVRVPASDAKEGRDATVVGVDAPADTAEKQLAAAHLQPPAMGETTAQNPGSTKENIDMNHWHRVVESLKIGGIAKQLASNCVFQEWDGTTLRLRLDPSHKQMQVGSSEQRLCQALENWLGSPVRLRIEVGTLSDLAPTPAQQEARTRAARQQSVAEEMAADSLVQNMQERFGARIVPGSIKPVEDE